MKRLNGFGRLTAAVLLGTLLAQSAAFAQTGPDPRTLPRDSRIVGVWDVTVTVTNCAGFALFEFPAMHKYELGGTGQVVPATDPTALSAHLMVWNNIGGNRYGTSMKMFRFDGDGNYIGWIVVTSEVSVNRAANSYAGSGVAEFYDANGNQVAASCPQFAGTRLSG